MIFYYNSDTDLKLQADNLSNNLDHQITCWNKKLETLLECLNQLNSVIQNTDNIDNPEKVTNLLEEFKYNLDSSRTAIADFKNLREMLSLIISELPNLDTDSLVGKLSSYNDKAISLLDNNNLYLKLEDFILQYIKKTQFNPNYPNTTHTIKTETNSEKETNKTLNKNSEPIDSKNDELIDNNVLLISEIQNKISLPYKVSDLKKKLDNKHYKSIQDIINSEYTFTLDKYNNAPISRFRETYNLMRKKEKASISDSLDLALELTFKNLLNPAIISACKNLDQLDIYLDCLASNELDKFTFFEIKYEILPKKTSCR